MAPHARRCRPARHGFGLRSWWRASGPIRIFFLDKIKLNVLSFNTRKKNNMIFYLKRHVVCLENKNVMQFILSKFLNEKRESLAE